MTAFNKCFLFFIPFSLALSSCGDKALDDGQNSIILSAKFMSAGSAHTCAVLEDDSLKCWGSNQSGALGDGSFTDRPTPASVDLTGDQLPESVIAGDNHTCAILEDNSLECWGSNRYGQLGTSTTNDEQSTPVTVDLGGGRTVKAVSVGGNHTCAILNDDSLSCWGYNGFGQLGNNTTVDEGAPIAVDLGSGKTAKAVSAGGNHTCAILDDDSLKCWGDNDYGQLGDNSTTQRPTPTDVGLGSNTAKAMSARDKHTCAILDDDSLKCWGDNDYGQLGDGTTNDRDEPTAVNLGMGQTVKAVGVGRHHTCAVLNDDSLSCWGYNGFGQLGDGTNTDRSNLTAVMLGTGRTVKTMTVGRNHICAILDNDSAKCWGSNSLGQLGYGGPVYRITPTAVDLGTVQTATAASVGNNHTCVIRTGNSLVCWGNNQSGQLGDGTNANSSTPVVVDLGTNMTAKAVSVGYAHTCAILNDDTLRCWGNNEHGQLGDSSVINRLSPVAINLGSNRAKEVSAGAYHTCVILDNDSLSCWGYNDSGQLGDNSTTERHVPTAIALGGNTAEAISAGQNHTCAILSNNSLSCWGRNSFGQLGDGTTVQRNVPTAVGLGGSAPKAVSVGGEHTCAILNNDSLRCWGYNSSHQLGDGTDANRDTPVNINLGTGQRAKAVSAGHFHTCAILLNDDSLKCWGYNQSGQLGDSTTSNRATPIPVDLGTGQTAEVIGASYYTTCAILGGNSLKCWGYTGVAKTYHRGDDADEMGDNLPAINLN